MIPEIGFMIGAYIVTRMVALILAPEPKPGATARVLALVTILISTLVMLDLLLRGTTGLNVNDLR